MTKENEFHTGDLWFNPNEPDKLCVFKNDQWEKIPDDEMQWSDKQKNIMQIANYKQQLAELETQFWFNDLPTKGFTYFR